MNFWVAEGICVIVQAVGFIPFYLEYLKDCKEVGKERLAVPLVDRVKAWLTVFPVWVIPIICAIKDYLR